VCLNNLKGNCSEQNCPKFHLQKQYLSQLQQQQLDMFTQPKPFPPQPHPVMANPMSPPMPSQPYPGMGPYPGFPNASPIPPVLPGYGQMVAYDPTTMALNPYTLVQQQFMAIVTNERIARLEEERRRKEKEDEERRHTEELNALRKQMEDIKNDAKINDLKHSFENQLAQIKQDQQMRDLAHKTEVAQLKQQAETATTQAAAAQAAATAAANKPATVIHGGPWYPHTRWYCSYCGVWRAWTGCPSHGYSNGHHE